MNGICESCNLHPVTNLIYFDDNGPTFAVCRHCAEASTGFYGTVVDLDEHGQVMIALPGGDAA